MILTQENELHFMFLITLLFMKINSTKTCTNVLIEGTVWTDVEVVPNPIFTITS